MLNTVPVSLETSAVEMFRTVGIISDVQNVPQHLELFASQADRVIQSVRDLVLRGEMSSERACDFQQLVVDACARVICHPIVATNRYLERFAQGVSLAQARLFTPWSAASSCCSRPTSRDLDY